MAMNDSSEDSQMGVTKNATWPFGVQPKPNSPTRSLIAMNAMNGWPDPNKIYDPKTGESEDISLWDHARTAQDYEGLAGITGIPAGTAPAPEVRGSKDPTGGPTLSEEMTWNHPDVSRETKENGKPKMTLSDPEPGIVDY